MLHVHHDGMAERWTSAQQELHGAGNEKDSEVTTGLMRNTAVPTSVPALVGDDAGVGPVVMFH